MEPKFIATLRSSAPRFLCGLLGAWCCIGPIILVMGAGQWALKLILLVILVVCYGYVFHLWSRRGAAPVKKMMTETKWAICFMIIGLLLSEMTGVFTRLKLEMSALYMFIGFFLAEFIRSSTSMKSAGEMLALHIRNRLPF
jgi:hypothetical protein